MAPDPTARSLFFAPADLGHRLKEDLNLLISPPRHHPITILLHWLTAILIALGVTLILGREWIDEEPSRQWLLDVHRFLGLSVLGLALTRMVLRPLLRTSQVNRGLPPLLARLAGLSHGGLYLLLVALPLLGWAQWSASGKPMRLFGVFSVPTLFGFGPDRDLAEALGDWHAGLAWLLIALVAAHALAALWHHFARRDPVLRSMLPEGGKPIRTSTSRRALKPALLSKLMP